MAHGLLASQPASAVRLSKKMLKRGNISDLQDTIMEEGIQFMERLKSPEAAEALQAFMERCQPDFSKLN
jgi:enoyl-CoA hydratase/carnithine racemase